ncbi:NAD(P)(+) transhydrogenase (Re/Si-specific) subunit beta [Fluviicola taffensis]|uniref:NAD(P) transhydrogenase subunit beta n=1 Tax=Fluviicola taffensis (strain DSM 16823 / NCIMB 13979 / RW262) TaxID=755732 RepID=F2IAJ1_FLUTR|nr:NAD(P)(+) transhydrogenase (Re/Si-specific) subunit beta [Fluviicola taffensis]AEA43127.1 NAD(P)(+) transhydrogenase (AB-specific) [Fluviicola taffensis DSM 16823]
MTILLEVSYFLAMISFIIGLKFLSSPQHAKLGNIIAGGGMTLAIIVTVYHTFYAGPVTINLILIIIAILLGTILGRRMSDKAEMTKMPQLVSYFNAMGGGCALLLGIIEGQQLYLGQNTDRVAEVVLMTAMMIGATSFSGSVIAYLKLSGKVKDIRTRFVSIASRLLIISMIVLPFLVSFEVLHLNLIQEIAILGSLATIYGLVFVFPIGGADMPVVISLLNSLTGVATALAGILFHNLLMISGGIFVGSAGVLLTLLMCKAMNRSLWNVLAGNFKNSGSSTSSSAVEMEIKRTSIGELATNLAFSSKVAIIPGYGLAVAQAQHLCTQLEQLLETKGVEVDYIIHPVAGRMPGHMNVLLAEADVHYDKLREMDEVNDSMSSYDVSIVIGANDVVNPAAENDSSSPIFGMPIIKAYNSKQVVVIKRGMSKGYAGVENSLFGEDNCQLLFADAKDALSGVIGELKTLNF